VGRTELDSGTLPLSLRKECTETSENDEQNCIRMSFTVNTYFTQIYTKYFTKYNWGDHINGKRWKGHIACVKKIRNIH
jgi:hypothetical protein